MARLPQTTENLRLAIESLSTLNNRVFAIEKFRTAQAPRERRNYRGYWQCRFAID